MAKHSSKHRKLRNKRLGSKASTLSKVGLVAGGLTLIESVLLATATAAPTAIFIDGHNYPDAGTRMAQQLQGQYLYDPNCGTPCTHLASGTGANQVFIQYPAKLGLLDGFGAPTGDQSINAAQLALDQQLTDPRTQTPITVVAYSEGAVAASHEVTAPNLPADTAFVLIANPERPNGGILARFPAGTYIPFIGITAGHATSNEGAPVVMMTRQYDGVADAPAYPINVLADANAFLGFYYLHSTYQTVNPNDPNTAKIVTQSPNGNMTDILILAPQGQLPVFMPLAQAGVPQPILVALDPAVRALIETGYDRTSDPSQQVRFGLLPSPSAWPSDVQMVVVGFITTGERLPGAVLASIPGTSTLPGIPTLPGTPTLPVLAPVQKAAPTSPSPGANLPSNPSAPQGEPASRPQQTVLVSRQTTSNPPPDAGTQPVTTKPAITNSGPSPTEQSPPAPVQPQVTKPNPKPPFNIDMAAGGKLTPGTSDTGGESSSSVGKPLQSAVTNVTNAIGSMTGRLTGSTSTGGTSSPSKPGSAG